MNGYCSNLRSFLRPKSQLVRYPNRKTMGNNDKQWCVIVCTTNEETPYQQLHHCCLFFFFFFNRASDNSFRFPRSVFFLAMKTVLIINFGILRLVDIDECASGTHDCHSSLASCTNTVGSFSCSCNSPSTGDGRTCNLPSGNQLAGY